MQKNVSSYLLPTSLAIFSMLFGAGNLMYPINVGNLSGSMYPLATFAFLITAAFIPLAGLVAIILCNGDYEEFFGKIGKIPSKISIFACLTFIGPVYVMPRIVGVSHTMLKPFCPMLSLWLFIVLFLGLTFLITYKESRVMQILGNVISPILLVSLSIVIGLGIFNAESTTVTNFNQTKLFWDNIIYGYNTLDLLGAIFFSSMVITLLTKSLGTESKKDTKTLVFMGLKAGILGTFFLTAVYIGLSHLGAFHGQGMSMANEAEIFSTIAMRVIDGHGAIIISIAVLMACLSTVVALATILAEYIEKSSNNKIPYITALILTLVGTGISSSLGLTNLLHFYNVAIVIAHPALIVLTFLVIANKLFGYKHIKLPVLATFIFSIVSYFWM